MSKWYERWGGYIVSIFIHILLISVLVSAISLQTPQEAQGAFEVSFEFAPQADAAPADAQEQQQEPAPPPPDVAAATGDMEDIVENLFEQLDELEPPPPPLEATDEAEAPEPAPEATPEPTPPPSEEPTLDPQPTPKAVEELTPEKLIADAKAERQKKLEAAWEQYKNMKPSNNRRDALKQAVSADEVKVKGMEHLDEYTPGAETGAVRQFDLRGNPDLIKEIMGRYQLRYVTRYVKDVGPGYLNKADTTSGSFYAPTEPGMYEVLEIGEAGTAKLRTLEIQALRANGFNPSTDRVVSITFGIVRTEQGWDLGVTDFKGEKIGP